MNIYLCLEIFKTFPVMPLPWQLTREYAKIFLKKRAWGSWGITFRINLLILPWWMIAPPGLDSRSTRLRSIVYSANSWLAAKGGAKRCGDPRGEPLTWSTARLEWFRTSGLDCIRHAPPRLLEKSPSVRFGVNPWPTSGGEVGANVVFAAQSLNDYILTPRAAYQRSRRSLTAAEPLTS